MRVPLENWGLDAFSGFVYFQGAPILEGETSLGNFVFHLAWGPTTATANRLLYQATEVFDRAAISLVNGFATAEAARVTSFVGEFAGQVSVSGDGRHFVFERAGALNQLTGDLVRPDLWIVGRDGSALRLLVEDAYAPAWSR